MNQDDITRMAREADLIYWLPNSRFSDGVWWMDAGEPGDELERFAALVAAHEREACAYRASIALLGADLELANRVIKAIQARGKV